MITQVKTTLFVQDEDRALDFYVSTLGFEKRRDLPYEQSGFRWIEVSIPGTRTILVFGRESGSDPRQSGQPCLVLETDNIQEMYETWRERGVIFTDPPKAQPWGTQAIFVDSEGNVLVLVQS